MALPNSKLKIRKRGENYKLEFESQVDAVKYTKTELCRAALRDTAKLLRRKVGDQLVATYKNQYVGYLGRRLVQKTRYGKLITRYPRRATEYWVRKRETDLQIGFKERSWYAYMQELGDKGYPKQGILRNTTYNSIGQIRQVQAQYLSALNQEQPFDPGDAEYKTED